MAQKDWKFHDYNMRIEAHVRENERVKRCPVIYTLTNLPAGSSCTIYSSSGDESSHWTRKTRNEGKNGSIRYIAFDNLDQALEAGIAWARRKDEEAAAGAD